MKAKGVLFIALFFSIALPIKLHSQTNWKDALNDSNANFYDIKNKFYNWANTFTGSDSTLSKSLKRFQRFEFFWQNRISAPGNLNGKFSTWAEAFSNAWDDPYCTALDEASWVTEGPFPGTEHHMGLIASVWNDPQDQNFIIAGSRMDGIWRSTNGGYNWSCVSDNQRIPLMGVYTLAVSPNKINNKRVIYAGTGGEETRHYSIGILKSEDGGDTWNVLENFPPHAAGNKAYLVSKVAVAQNILPGYPDIIFAAYNEKLYKSVNSGQTWTQCSNLTTSGKIFDIEIFPSNNSNIVVSTRSYTDNLSVFHRAEIWFSSDLGQNWVEIGQNIIDPNLSQLTEVAISVPLDDQVYCYVCYSDA